MFRRPPGCTLCAGPLERGLITEQTDGLHGDSQEDIPEALKRYGSDNSVPTMFADAVCICGSRPFGLEVDEEQGVAVRVCVACSLAHPMADSAEYLDVASLESCECLCDARRFELTMGLALYEDSEDVRWLYIGARCSVCGLVGCYGDWKNEFPGYQELLARV